MIEKFKGDKEKGVKEKHNHQKKVKRAPDSPGAQGMAIADKWEGE